jgi:hypothetical protein
VQGLVETQAQNCYLFFAVQKGFWLKLLPDQWVGNSLIIGQFDFTSKKGQGINDSMT